MKQHVSEFVHRGLKACGLGPLVLAAVYMIIDRQLDLGTLPVREVCIGIVSLSALAFIAGGLNMLYQIERLPLMMAVLIHGLVLYLSYLATYLINGWLELGAAPILVFSGIFVVGYLVIWVVICAIIRRRTARINQILSRNREKEDPSQE